ncbi:MAG: AAA family ATPase [Candidatus Glassbacteria bacterium]
MEAGSAYLDYFGFSEDPFSLTPNPAYFYLTREHELALVELERGVSERKGLVLLVGEMGTGKTILLRTLEKKLPERVLTSYQLNPSIGFVSIVKMMLRDFGLPHEMDSKAELISMCHEKFSELGDQGTHGVLILDEAQGLSEEVLEDIRILSNIEDEKGKLLSIILSGQPELADRISASSLRSLKHRIGVRIYLKPMDSDEISLYIEHRLKVAGWREEESPFTKDSLKWITFSSNGNPRLINVIADNALHRALREKVRTVDKELIKKTISGLEGREALRKPESRKFSLRRLSPVSIALIIFLVVLSIFIVKRIRERMRMRTAGRPETSALLDTIGLVSEPPETPLRETSPIIREETPSQIAIGEEAGGEAGTSRDERGEDTTVGSGLHDVEVMLDSVSPIEAGTSYVEPEGLLDDASVTVGEEEIGKSGVKGWQIVVQDNEYLYLIIKREYGSMDWKTLKAVLEVNSDIEDPDYIYPGQKIFLPEITEIE